MFDGQVFSELPIVHIKCSKNNTLFTASDAKGKIRNNKGRLEDNVLNNLQARLERGQWAQNMF